MSFTAAENSDIDVIYNGLSSETRQALGRAVDEGKLVGGHDQVIKIAIGRVMFGAEPDSNFKAKSSEEIREKLIDALQEMSRSGHMRTAAVGDNHPNDLTKFRGLGF